MHSVNTGSGKAVPTNAAEERHRSLELVSGQGYNCLVGSQARLGRVGVMLEGRNGDDSETSTKHANASTFIFHLKGPLLSVATEGFEGLVCPSSEP